MKNCIRCNIDITERGSRFKYCIECSEISKKECSLKFRKKEENKEKLLKYGKKYYNMNKERLKPIRKKWREDNYDKDRKYNKERYDSFDKERLYNYYEQNKEEINRKRSEYRKTEEYKKWKKEYDLKNSYKSRYRDSLKSVIKRLKLKKNNYTNELLGYSDLDFKLHIESQFVGDMSWENKNSFEIDHIIPISAFIENTPLNIVSALDNLKPMDPIDNLKKFTSIDYDHINIYEKYIDFLKPEYSMDVLNYLNVIKS